MTEDEDIPAVSNNGSGQAVVIRMVGFDRPFFTALAVTLALAACVGAYLVHSEARMAEYYSVDLEVYMLKQGFKPPPDPWRQNHGDVK